MAAKGKWADWVTEDGLNTIRGWARDGFSDAQIAKNMGIGKSAFYDWQQKFPEFKEAIKKGRAPVVVELEDALYKAGLGYTYEEIMTEMTTDEDGNEHKHIKKIQRYARPDVVALIFALKNLKKQKFKDKPIDDVNRADDPVIAMLRRWDDAAKEQLRQSETD